MFGAYFVLFVLPLLVIGTSVLIYFVSRRERGEDR